MIIESHQKTGIFTKVGSFLSQFLVELSTKKFIEISSREKTTKMNNNNNISVLLFGVFICIISFAQCAPQSQLITNLPGAVSFCFFFIFSFQYHLQKQNHPSNLPIFFTNSTKKTPKKPAVNFAQYSGYININGTQKNLFYWFVESQNDPKTVKKTQISPIFSIFLLINMKKRIQC